MTGALLRAVADAVLPQRCPGCGVAADPDRLLCGACLARIPRLRTILCVRCLSDGREGAGCRRHRAFAVHAPWLFDERAAALVHALKYHGRPALAVPLGAEMAAALPAAGRPADLVLEVPLHPARLRERGYNQSAALADALAEAIGVPHLPDALRRVRATAPQARLGPAARRANLAGAFAIERPSWLRGRRVLLVDDVVTTGATLDAALSALHDAGAIAAAVALAWAQ
ncbi:MAG: ComF family protein [Candidatus Eisenbacteria bacterium]|nr:ComF family protein [Candidatus Eisenbacteria bacterium]